MIDIGKEIRAKLRESEHSVTWFAQKLHIRRAKAYDIFAKNSIDTAELSRICKVLDYNFFDLLAEETRDMCTKKKTEVYG